MTAANKIGICQWCIPVSGPEALILAAQMGYDGVEMDMGFNKPAENLLDGNNLERFLEAKENAGIQTPSLAFNGFAMNRAEGKEERRAAVREAVKVAKALNAGILQMPSFFEAGMRNEEEFLETAEMLKYICREAAPYGITVGTENQLDAEQNLRLIELVGEPNFAVYFDNANPYMFDRRDGVAMLKELYPHICELHVKDFELRGSKPCRPLGKGKCHVKETLQYLKEKGYDRWIVVENDLSADELKRDGEWIRKYMNA